MLSVMRKVQCPCGVFVNELPCCRQGPKPSVLSPKPQSFQPWSYLKSVTWGFNQTPALSFQKDWIKVAEFSSEFNSENGLQLSVCNENFSKLPTLKEYSGVLTSCLSSEIPIKKYIAQTYKYISPVFREGIESK